MDNIATNEQLLDAMYEVARFELRRLADPPTRDDLIYAGIAAAIIVLGEAGWFKKSQT